MVDQPIGCVVFWLLGVFLLVGLVRVVWLTDWCEWVGGLLWFRRLVGWLDGVGGVSVGCLSNCGLVSYLIDWWDVWRIGG